MVRGLLLVATALSTGYAAGRRYLDREIEKRKENAIEAAAIQVRAQLRQTSEAFLNRSLKQFARSLCLRAALIISLFLAFKLGLLDAAWLAGLIITTIAGFLIYDGTRSWSDLKPELVHLRQNQWRPITALKTVVAAHTFDQVLAQAEAQTATRSNTFWITLSSRKRQDLSKEVAEAVATIAAEASFDDVKPFLKRGLIRGGLMVGLYSTTLSILFLFI